VVALLIKGTESSASLLGVCVRAKVKWEKFNFPEGKAMASIRMYTTTWCGDCHNAKRYLKEQGVEFEEINIEEDDAAAAFVIRANEGKRKVPTFEVEGRTFNLSPFNAKKLRTELGLG
jgi:mycoredoxin